MPRYYSRRWRQHAGHMIYAEIECFGAGALTSFKIPRTDIDVTGLSTDYDGSICANIDILKGIGQDGIRASVYSPAQH